MALPSARAFRSTRYFAAIANASQAESYSLPLGKSTFMKLRFSLGLVLFSSAVFSQNLHQYVNPFVGTGGHGHTFPGATLPYGMVQLSPDTRIDDSWDGCSGYHYSDKIIYGFSHTHLNGTGVPDFGDIMLMPTMGTPSLRAAEYSSTFSHDNEKATAGFYSVKLDKHNIDVRLTATTRVGLHEYTFNSDGQANIILDLNHRDQLLMGEVRVVNSSTIEVMRNSSAWAKDQRVFARIEFSQPMFLSGIDNNGFRRVDTSEPFFAGSVLRISFSKKVLKGEKLMVKVALSPTGTPGAAKNMSELPGWDFEKTKASAEAAWDKELSRIIIETDNLTQKRIFYTALYHTMMQPNIAQDIDGKYLGRDFEIHQADGFDYYAVFSLWDTFRAAHPLYTLIDKKRTADYINTFLKQYEQGGRLPVWELASNETDCMIGYHSVSVIADAMMKGIAGFDYEKAYEAAKHSAMLDHLGLEAYKKNGFIAMDDEHESASKTVEYAYDDWCIAQMAQKLGKSDDYAYFMKRSQSWKNLFDKSTGHIRAKKNGGWDTPFEPREVNNNYTEGNSWQYTFFAPHDIGGMIEAHGGQEGFAKKLDELFSAPEQTTGREQADITGLIGQYAHGNEPSHHVTYLYSHAGQPKKTAEKVHFILNEFYKDAPDGLIGNEDCGQMSAWYVLSSIGLYQVTPGRLYWDEVPGIFKSVEVDFGNGKKGTVKDGVFAPADTLFGFDVTSSPARPKVEKIVPVPAIQADGKAFLKKMKVSLVPAGNGDELYYAVNDFTTFKRYKKPFTIDRTSTVYAYAQNGSKTSNTVQAHYFKKPNDFAIDIQSVYTPQYHGGGPLGLLDGIEGDLNWRKGDWQGYQGQDFECVVDMKKARKISSVNTTFLQDSRAWVLMPTEVEYFVSTDGRDFKSVGKIQNKFNPKITDVTILPFEVSFAAQPVRYVKVRAKHFGKLPDWHQGFGGDAYIFVDEVRIK